MAEFMEFPKTLYNVDGDNIVVMDAQAESDASASGFLSVEAIAAKKAEPQPKKPAKS